MSALAPELLRLLRDPRAQPSPPSPEAHAAAMLRAHALGTLARASRAASVPVLLVKGAALALGVYTPPAARAMGDIDVLVCEDDRDRLLVALEEEGGTVHHPEGRARSRELLGETAVMLPAGALTVLVEVHTSLDKLVPRPIAVPDLLERATPAPGLPGLFLPAFEDHALLIALHLAGHDFQHPAGLLDLEMLLRRGLDRERLVERARAWSLGSVMFASLEALRALGAASASEELVQAFAPGPLRRAILQRVHPPGAPPRGGDRLGLPWVLRQAPLRDDVLPWMLGLARYGALRARERRALSLAPREHAVQDAPVSYRVPRWVRAVLAVDRLTLRLDNVRDGLRDELMLAWIPEADRGALSAALYADQSTYLPGGHRFQSGLFAWEQKALEAPDFPRKGRILLGACGAGRELVALLDRGFELVAFDPCAPFADAARAQVDPARATVIHASYADLIAAASGAPSPLAPALAGAPFAAVIFGWGSFSHVMPARERLALLRAAATLAPGAPLLMSFALEPELPTAMAGSPAPEAAGKGRVRGALRRLFTSLGAPGPSEQGDHFYPNGGFFSFLRRADLIVLVQEAGYAIALFEESPYAHALLVPRTEVRGTKRESPSG